MSLSMRFLLPTLFACSALFAQDQASLNRFVPKDSRFVLHMASPAAWKAQFAKTRVSKLMQTAAMAPIVGMLDQAMEGAMSELRSSGKLDAEVVEKFLSDYQGQMTLALQVDMDGLAEAMQSGKSPKMSGVLAVVANGKNDLSALATTLASAFEAGNPDKLRDLKVGDQLFRYIADSDVHVGVPTLVEGHLVWIFGTDLPKSADKLLAKDQRFDGGAANQALYCNVDLGSLMQGFTDMLAGQMEDQGAPFDMRKLMQAFGLLSIRNAQLQLGADGADMTTELKIDTTGKDLGILGMTMLDQGTPKLLRYIPASAENFGITPFDFGAIYSSIATLWGELEDVVPMTFEDAMAEVTDFLKVRLKEDLLDHMGTEMLNVVDAAGIGESLAAMEDEDGEANMLGMLNGSCMAISLRNGAAFAESLEKVIRARGMHASRKSEEYQGTKIYKVLLAGMVETEYAVVDDALLLAIGKSDSARNNLRGMLDQRASGNASGSLPTKLQKRLQALPEGWSGISVSSMPSTLTAMKDALDGIGAMAELPMEMEGFGEMLGSLAGELKRLGLETMLSTTHTSKKSMVMRLRW